MLESHLGKDVSLFFIPPFSKKKKISFLKEESKTVAQCCWAGHVFVEGKGKTENIWWR